MELCLVCVPRISSYSYMDNLMIEHFVAIILYLGKHTFSKLSRVSLVISLKFRWDIYYAGSFYTLTFQCHPSNVINTALT